MKFFFSKIMGSDSYSFSMQGVVILGWLVAAACALAVLYGLYDVSNGHPLSTPVSAFYSSTHRTVWAAAIGWVLFACTTGNGGKVTH